MKILKAIITANNQGSCFETYTEYSVSDVEYLDKIKIKTDNNGKYPFNMLADLQKVNDAVESSIEDQIKFISKDTLKPYPTSALPNNILNYKVS